MPEGLFFDVSSDKRVAVVEVTQGLGIDALDLRVHPAGEKAPVADFSDEVDAFAVVDLRGGDPAVNALLPAGSNMEKVTWDFPQGSDEADFSYRQGAGALRPSFAFVFNNPDLELWGDASQLPERFHWESPQEGAH